MERIVEVLKKTVEKVVEKEGYKAIDYLIKPEEIYVERVDIDSIFNFQKITFLIKTKPTSMNVEFLSELFKSLFSPIHYRISTNIDNNYLIVEIYTNKESEDLATELAGVYLNKLIKKKKITCGEEF
jgi:ribosomal protein S17E